MFKKILQHKLISGIILLLIIAGGYFGYQWLFGKKSTTQYVTAQVEKGTLIVSVSGSGQVSASNQVDIKPKVSGDVVYVNVKKGEEVKAGTLLVQLDNSDAQKAVRDAQTALETAKLELEELLQPADAYSLMQAENALIQAKDNLTKLKFTQESNYQDALDAKQKAEDNLEKAYEDGFNDVANTFLDLPNIMSGLYDILFSSSFSSTQQNIDYYADAVKTYNEKALQYKTDTYNKYQIARKAYDQNFQDYKSASRFSEKNVIESLINQTYETVKSIAEAVKSANNLIQFYQDELIERNLKPQTLSNTHLSNLNTYTGKTNSHLSTLLSIQRTIQDNKEAKLNAERDLAEMDQNNPLDLAAAERAIKEKEESLAKLKAGADELDIRAKKIAVQQKEDALITAQQNLADHYIRAPFDGVVADIKVKKGESVSSNPVATLITRQKIAEISLNEVDVAKVKIGQKTTLTFDAVPDLSLTGEVVEIDTLGTVTQGVVTYNIKIGFDTQDERVKPGMSVSAVIVTEVKPDVLLVPNSAIKSQGEMSYVEMPAESDVALATANPNGVVFKNPLRRQPVEIGLANDEFTEITDGLKEGDIIVTRTIQPTATQTTQQQSGGLRIPGLNTGGGGGVRIMR